MAGETIHGVRAVREALAHPGRVNRVYFARESRARGCDDLIAAVRAARLPADFVPQAKLNAMTGARDHQGVAAEISPLAYAPLDDCIAQCGPRALVLALDRVQHARNLGMLLRAAAGAGATAVIAPQRGGALLDQSVVRASAGAAFRVPIATCANLPQTLRGLKDAGFWIYALEAGGEQDALTMQWPDRCVIVAGNESGGLRPGVRKVCDAGVAIPLAEGVESLNVAVAAGIAMFQAAAAIRR